ncbi:MAG: hypothetical protein R2734_04055 [Nocardioides sp.]
MTEPAGYRLVTAVDAVDVAGWTGCSPWLAGWRPRATPAALAA